MLEIIIVYKCEMTPFSDLVKFKFGILDSILRLGPRDSGNNFFG